MVVLMVSRCGSILRDQLKMNFVLDKTVLENSDVAAAVWEPAMRRWWSSGGRMTGSEEDSQAERLAGSTRHNGGGTWPGAEGGGVRW